MRVLPIAAAVFAAVPALAGPLDPPQGPITSTYKTLSEVEPRTAINAQNTPGDADSVYRITEPGSYYLTENLTGKPGKHGIEIAAGDVTLDLAGFTLTGAQGSLSAIYAETPEDGITISDGLIRAWGATGIHIVSSDSCRVSRVTIAQCSGMGIMVDWNCIVESCIVEEPGQHGIHTGGNCRILNCTVYSAGTGPGFFLGSDSVAESCTASAGDTDGFELYLRAAAINCAAIGNGGDGFQISDNASLSNCTADGNGGSGIDTAHGARISGCTAQANGAHGITAGSGSLIENNFARQNGLNHTSGGGIYLSGVCSRARISGNTCVDNDIGIYAQGSYNLIFGNTCSTNDTNFNIAGNNRVGTLAVPPLSSPINGNSGGAGLGSTDPWVNLSY
jgi:parallel beta-helix repeat protein